MDPIIALAFILNNALWMAFFYVFTPGRKKEHITLPKIKLPTIIKKKPHVLEDVTEGVSAADVLASMRVKE